MGAIPDVSQERSKFHLKGQVDQDEFVLLYNASRAVSTFLSHHHYELQADYSFVGP